MTDLAVSAAPDFPSSIRLMCCRGLLLREVNKHGSGAVLLHRSNAIVASCSRAIGLADTDDLVVGCAKREVRAAVGSGQLRIEAVERRMLTAGCDAVLAATFLQIAFAMQDGFTVRGFQAEVVLLILGGAKELVFGRHIHILVAPVGSGGGRWGVLDRGACSPTKRLQKNPLSRTQKK